jgi:DNA replication protein DnaC
MVEAYYAPLSAVLDHIRGLLKQGEEWSDFWQRLLDVPVLCLDEVTRFYETDWARERLWLLADRRYERRGSHLTCFATNDDPKLHVAVTDSIGYLFSRMRQGTLVELRGDMRQAAD